MCISVCVCKQRERGPERRRKKEVKRRGIEKVGERQAETSRTGKITHFDGIKMSVFPSPISMEIAHLWKARQRKRNRRDEGRGRTDFCLFSVQPVRIIV